MPILVCPLSYVPDVIAARRPTRLVSLLDPDSTFPDGGDHGIDRHLRLAVHDISADHPGWTAPSAEHVRELLRFVSDWDRTRPILVHCLAGVSRSTASAYAIACALNPGHDEAEIAWELRRASPTAWPNRRIVALADAELDRAGRMSRAIAAIGEGLLSLDSDEAEPFEIRSRYAE